MIILDTNIVSELLRPSPEPKVEAWLAAQNGAEVFLTAVTEAELRYGVAILPEGMRRAAIADAVEACFSKTSVIVSCRSTALPPHPMP